MNGSNDSLSYHLQMPNTKDLPKSTISSSSGSSSGGLCQLIYDPNLNERLLSAATTPMWPVLLHAFGPPADMVVSLSGFLSPLRLAKEGRGFRCDRDTVVNAARPAVRHMHVTATGCVFGVQYTMVENADMTTIKS